MAGGKQKELERGTNEYLFGIEWDVVKRLTISGGAQITDYGLSDNFQSDVSFSCDSYSLGFGAKVMLSEKMALNVDICGQLTTIIPRRWITIAARDFLGRMCIAAPIRCSD